MQERTIMVEMKELIILPLQPKRPRRPLLYVDERLDPQHCPYCGKKFSQAVGCRKVCTCGYMEGCED
jgi:hypothetical protein